MNIDTKNPQQNTSMSNQVTFKGLCALPASESFIPGLHCLLNIKKIN